MSNENELNESEMDQLLRELEQKADSKPAPSKATKVAPQPKNATKKELPKEKPKTSEVVTIPNPEKSEPRANGVSVVQRGSSDSLNRKISIFLAFLTTPLLLGAIWMLGNYLGNFVSVGWLIAIVSLFGITGLSYFFKRLVGRGRFMVWSGLVSLLLLVAMLIPAEIAAQRMVEFGHWPISSITRASGMENDNVFVSFSNRISKVLADFRSSFNGEPVVSFPKELGKELPLIPEVKPTEPEVEEEKKVEKKAEKEADKKVETP